MIQPIRESLTDSDFSGPALSALSISRWEIAKSERQAEMTPAQCLAAYGLLWNENYPDHPLVGGFHLCRFAKEQGDFSHHYFPSLDDEAETFLLMRDLFDRVKKAERRLR
jgi:hypothetical protein